MSRLSLERAEFVAWMMKLDPKLAVEEAIKTERSWLRGTVEDTSVEYASVFLALDVADCEPSYGCDREPRPPRRLDAVSALAELGG